MNEMNLIQTQLQTTSRDDFIKVCAMVASGIDPEQHQCLVISISGRMDVGKSLVADAMIASLSDDKDPHELAYDNKMSFEKEPAQAAKFPVRGYACIGGRKVDVRFVRSSMDYHEVKNALSFNGDNHPSIIFFADTNHLQSADVGMRVSLTNPYPHDPGKDYPQWVRKWDVLLSPDHMFYDRMLSTVMRLNGNAKTAAAMHVHHHRSFP